MSSVVTKPVVGVFDLASNLGEGEYHRWCRFAAYMEDEGIRNTTTVFDAPHRDRVRLVSESLVSLRAKMTVISREQSLMMVFYA